MEYRKISETVGEEQNTEVKLFADAGEGEINSLVGAAPLL